VVRGTPSAPPRRRLSALQAWTRGLLAATAVAWALAPIRGVELSLWILTAAGLAAVLAGLRRPPVCALGLGLLCTLDPVSRLFLMTGGLLRWNSLNYLLIVLAVLFARHVIAAAVPPVVLLGGLTLLLGFEIVLSSQPDLGLQHVLPVAATFGLVACFVRAAGEPRLWRAMALVNGAAAGLGGLAFFALQTPLINRNAWGWFPLTALFSIALASAAGTRGSGFTLLLLAFVNLTWAFLSASRGDLLVGLIATGFIVLAGRAPGRRMIAATVAAVVAIAIASHFVALSDEAVARLGRLTTSDGSLRERTSGRSDLALGGWYIFLDHPLGVGTGGFPAAWAALGDHEGLSGFQRHKEFNAHSGWVKTLAENGLPGFVLLLLFVLSFSLPALRGRGSTRALGVMTTLIFATALLTTEFQSKGLWFLAAGTIALGGLRIVRRVTVARSRPAAEPWRVAHG
jgi:hypothetical protein